MKVVAGVSRGSVVGRAILTVAVSAALLLATNVASAHAITRPQVLKRANSWIKKRVPYSQSSFYQGYRQDCSGFVSMALKLGTSYTSSTIVGRAKRISANSLKPGDAVRRSGHVEIFDGWKSKKNREYWALEESTWGEPALRRVKQFESGYMALRLPGIKDGTPATPAKPKPAPAPAPSVPATPSPTDPATGSAEASASAAANSAASECVAPPSATLAGVLASVLSAPSASWAIAAGVAS